MQRGKEMLRVRADANLHQYWDGERRRCERSASSVEEDEKATHWHELPAGQKPTKVQTFTKQVNQSTPKSKIWSATKRVPVSISKLPPSLKEA